MTLGTDQSPPEIFRLVSMRPELSLLDFFLSEMINVSSKIFGDGCSNEDGKNGEELDLKWEPRISLAGVYNMWTIEPYIDRRNQCPFVHSINELTTVTSFS